MRFLSKIPGKKNIYINESRDSFSQHPKEGFLEDYRYIIEGAFKIENFFTSSSYMGKSNNKISLRDQETNEIYFISQADIETIINWLNTDSRNGLFRGRFKIKNGNLSPIEQII
jgi:hypothetical protein